MTTRKYHDRLGAIGQPEFQTLMLSSSNGRILVKAIILYAFDVMLGRKPNKRYLDLDELLRDYVPERNWKGVIQFWRDHSPQGEFSETKTRQIWSRPGANSKHQYGVEERRVFEPTQAFFRFLVPFFVVAWNDKITALRLQGALCLHRSKWSNVGSSLVDPEVMGEAYVLGGPSKVDAIPEDQQGERKDSAKTKTTVRWVEPSEGQRARLEAIYGDLLNTILPEVREVEDVFSMGLLGGLG